MVEPLILHIEDEADDTFFVAWAFEHSNRGGRILHLEDGQKAIDYLRALEEHTGESSAPTPDLVLLDLKLPVASGFEVLRWIRDQPRFRRLPVVVLSGSSIESDVDRSRKLGANAYFVKTPLYHDLVDYVSRFLTQKVTEPVAACLISGD